MTFIPRIAVIVAAVILCCTSAISQVPTSKHVYIVAEENHSYQHLVGSANMPYLNGLINQNGLATQFYADQHSSLPDYFWVTAGQAITQDNETTLTFGVDNIVRRVMQLGLTYKSYAQSLPYAGFAGLYSGDYMKRHAPLPYFTDMGNSQTEMLKHVPIDQLLTDINSGNLPNFAFITPDAAHDMHNCPTTEAQCEQVADQFLQQYIQPLLARPEFQPGGDGLLIIWSDEADLDTDNACSAIVSTGCGGHILVALIGPQVKKGFQSTTTYHHESVLRTMLEALGVSSNFPGAANTAPDMAEFFGQSGPPTQQQLTVSSPANGATVSGQMHVVASAQSPVGVASMQIYVDGTLTYSVNAASIDTMQTLSPGTHNITIKAWDNNSNPFSQKLSVTASAVASVTVTSPAAGASVGSPVHVVAGGSAPAGVATMQIYADHQLVYSVNNSNIDTTLPLAAGAHSLTIKMWDNSGVATSKSLSITVTASAAVNVTSPAQGASVASPVHIVASGSSPAGVAAMQIYADGQLAYNVSSSTIDTMLPLTAGAHSLTIKMWDNNGVATSKSISVQVAANVAGVTLTSPTSGTNVGSPVHVVASATTGDASNPIGAMRIYVDNNSVYTVQTSQIDTYVTMSSGSHYIVIVAWDRVGASMTKSATISVP